MKRFHPRELSCGLLTVVAELDCLELVVAIDHVNLVLWFGEAQTGDSVGRGRHIFVVESDLRLEERVRRTVLVRFVLI